MNKIKKYNLLLNITLSFLFFDSVILYCNEKPSVIVDSLLIEFEKIKDNGKIKKNDEKSLSKLNDILHLYRYKNLDEAIEFANKYEKEIRKFSKSNQKATVYNKIGNIYHDLGKYNLAIENYSKCLNIFKEIKEPIGICNSYNDVGFIFSKLQLYEIAIKNYQLGASYTKSMSNDSYISSYAHSLSNIAYDYFNLNKVDSAIFYGEKSKKLFLKIKISPKVAQLNNYLAEFYSFNKMINKSIELTDENLKNLDTLITEDIRYLGHTYRIRAKLFYFLNNYELSLININIALHLLEKIELYSEVNKCLNIKSIVLNKLNRLDEAIKVAEFSYKMSSKRNSFSENYKNVDLLANLYKQKKDYKKSIYFYEISKTLTDSLFANYNKEIVNKFNIENELKNKDLQLELVSKKDEIENLWVTTLKFLICLLILVFAVFYYLYKKQIKTNNYLQKSLIEKEQLNEKLIISENNLIELNKTKDRFFGIISHDLKGPISSFYSATDLMIDEYEKFNDTEKLELLNLIKSNAYKLSELLKSLLNWARSQQGHLIPNPTKINVSFFIQDSVNLLKHLAKKKQIVIVNNVKNDIFIEIDKSMFVNVLNNIINNSIKFSYPHSQIIIRDYNITKDNKDFLAIDIEDKGIGITEENLNYLFKIEHQISTYGTMKEEGSGLGLILCKEYLNKNNGDITINSKLGIGTTVTLILDKTLNL